jgi:hypothetical protein
VQQQHHLDEVAALNLGSVALGPVQLAAFGPQAVTGPRGGAAGAALALVGGGPADGLEEECADAALGVIAGDPCQPAIDYVADAVNGDRGLRDIRGNDHLAQGIRREGEVLLVGRQVAVQRDEGETLVCADGPSRADGGVDLAHAGHENQDVPRLAGVDDLLDDVGGLFGDWPLVMLAQIAHFHREALSLRMQDWRLACAPLFRQILRHRLGLERRRHDGHLQIGTLSALQAFDQRQRDVAEQVALVELIE